MFSSFGGKPKDNTGSKSEASPKPPSQSSKSSESLSSLHGFDPDALERAAKAARELDASKNANTARDIIIQQEITKQKSQETERAKYLAHQQQLAIDRIREEEGIAERTLEKKWYHDKQLADYQDQKQRQRTADELHVRRQMQDEEREKTEASIRRQEAIRLKTIEREAALRQQTEMAKIEAETTGRIRQERENNDLIIAKRLMEIKEYRETVLESINLASQNFGNGIQEFLTDPTKLRNTVVTLTGLAFGIYTAKTSISVAGRFIESRLGKPSLVRETSRIDVLRAVQSPSVVLRHIYDHGRIWSTSSSNAKGALEKVVLEKSLEEKLQRIAVSTANTKRNKAPYRHLLLHGVPGTGKSMFAKGLAANSGMHYAIMTGGDIAPLGKDAVTEIHKLFDWANSTNKGLLIFVDEADAFLRKRSNQIISEDMRNALNAFLYRTGEASTKFMIVYASNQPEQFDWAINDRIDELVEFNLPKFHERLRMISQYIDEYLINPKSTSWFFSKKIIAKSDITADFLKQIAEETNGFSGREISKLAIAWQSAAYGNEGLVIDREMMDHVLQDMKKSKQQKLAWLSASEAESIRKNSS